jgi:hypothetical protein
MKSSIRLFTLTVIGALTVSGAINHAHASYQPNTALGFASGTANLGVNFEGGFSVYSGTAHLWSPYTSTGTGGYNTANASTGATTVVSATALDGNGFGDPFGLYVPASGTFYAGTYNGNSGTAAGGLWGYNGTWTKLGVYDSLFAAAANTSGTVYLSGLNSAWSGTYGQNNVIAVYTGGTFQPVIQTQGNSAGVAMDNSGNVYYADFDASGTAYLRSWTAAQVATALSSGTALTYAQSSTLTALPPGASATDTAVDDGGNVFVSINNSGTNGIIVWFADSGTSGGANYQYVAYLTTTPGGSFDWAGFLATTGNVLDGGALYAGSSAMLNDLTAITLPAELRKSAAAAAAVPTVKQPKATSNRDAIQQLIKARNNKTK